MLAVAASMFLVWACDRMARSTRHLLEVLDELKRIGVEFVSFRENLDTACPLGRAIVVIIGAIAELERSLIVEGCFIPKGHCGLTEFGVPPRTRCR